MARNTLYALISVFLHISIASKMTKDGNSLPAEYSSDGYVHHNKAGYALWVQFLKDTAVKYINQ